MPLSQDIRNLRTYINNEVETRGKLVLSPDTAAIVMNRLHEIEYRTAALEQLQINPLAAAAGNYDLSNVIDIFPQQHNNQGVA